MKVILFIHLDNYFKKDKNQQFFLQKLIKRNELNDIVIVIMFIILRMTIREIFLTHLNNLPNKTIIIIIIIISKHKLKINNNFILIHYLLLTYLNMMMI